MSFLGLGFQTLEHTGQTDRQTDTHTHTRIDTQTDATECGRK